LIPPAYVKPFVKRQKNEAADAEAISEAARRPSMRFVPVRTEEQQVNSICSPSASEASQQNSPFLQYKSIRHPVVKMPDAVVGPDL
jgi:hypothetical protein